MRGKKKNMETWKKRLNGTNESQMTGESIYIDDIKNRIIQINGTRRSFNADFETFEQLIREQKA